MDGRGRRRSALVVAVLGLGIVVASAVPGPALARVRTVHQTRRVQQACVLFVGDACYPAYRTTVKTRKGIHFAFVAKASHCTDIRLDVHGERVGGGGSFDAQFTDIAPGAGSGRFDFANAPAGLYVLDFVAADVPGGCGTPWSSWGGTLTLTTSKRERR